VYPQSIGFDWGRTGIRSLLFVIIHSDSLSPNGRSTLLLPLHRAPFRWTDGGNESLLSGIAIIAESAYNINQSRASRLNQGCSGLPGLLRSAP